MFGESFGYPEVRSPNLDRHFTNGGGSAMQSFLDRFRGKAKATPMMSSTRVRVIAVGDDRNKESMSASLLNNQGGV